jgi:4-aminobutyrate aminotransferase
LRNPTVEALEAKLEQVSPIPGAKVYLKVGGGSEANEGAIKMAQYVSKKSEVVSFWRSHLGQTVYTMGLSGNAFRQEPFNFPSFNNIKVPAPYCRRCFYDLNPDSCQSVCGSKISDFIEFGTAGRVAAIILEPIFGNGDNIVCPPTVAEKLREVSDKFGAALIYDEIQTGIGRTGTLFATEWLGGSPDIITIAKGLGGSGAQIVD